MPRVDHPCAWCTVRLRAVMNPPRFWLGGWYHPVCHEAAKLAAADRDRRRRRAAR